MDKKGNYLRTLNLKTKEDIETLLNAIIDNDEFKIGTVEPLKYRLVLDGGRYENFDPQLINADIAKIILSIQSNYDTLLLELQDKYNIIVKDSDKQLEFLLDTGSGIIETVLESEVLKNMESKHVMYVLIVSMLAFTGYEAYTSYIDKIKADIASKEKIELAKLEKEDRKDEREQSAERFNQLMDLTQELANNKNIQDSVNKPKRDVLTTLKNDEHIVVSSQKHISKDDKAKYNYKKPLLEDIEIVTTQEHRIETYNFLKPGKLFKFEGIAKSANSEILDAKKRMKLMSKADSQALVKVKLKTIKDPNTDNVKNIYILDYIED